jgi:hypothetical protein
VSCLVTVKIHKVRYHVKAPPMPDRSRDRVARSPARPAVEPTFARSAPARLYLQCARAMHARVP